MAETLIGIDIGTTTIKALLVDVEGNALAAFARPYPTRRPEPGHVEQDPNDWTAGVLAALASFAASGKATDVKGIGLTSQVGTHAFVGSNGAPLLAAMVWQDGRCAEDAAALDAEITAPQKTEWFGGPMPIDASHALSRMAHVARLQPGLYAKTRHVLLPKDYCALGLTGHAASDPISAVGLVDARLAYVPDLLALVPGARERLPPLIDMADRVGFVAAGLPFAGTPVFTGTMDAWAGMFGIGVIRDGDAMYLSGTSEVLGVISSNRTPTPGVIVFPDYKGITLHAAPTQSGGASLAWLAALIGKSGDEISWLAGATPRSTALPLFLPHLQGERAPLWDTASRGVFARLDGTTGPGELSRALLEGVALSARLALEAAEHSGGRTIDRLNIGGGGARSDVWCQIRADVLQKPVRRVATLDAGTVGAAVIAGLGTGMMPSLDAAIARLVRFDRTFDPDRDAGGHYDGRFAKYRELYESLRAFNAGFA